MQTHSKQECHILSALRLQIEILTAKFMWEILMMDQLYCPWIHGTDFLTYTITWVDFVNILKFIGEVIHSNPSNRTCLQQILYRGGWSHLPHIVFFIDVLDYTLPLQTHTTPRTNLGLGAVLYCVWNHAKRFSAKLGWTRLAHTITDESAFYIRHSNKLREDVWLSSEP